MNLFCFIRISFKKHYFCLLYTSDAADEGLGVDLGGRRIIKKKIRQLKAVNKTIKEACRGSICYDASDLKEIKFRKKFRSLEVVLFK